MTAFLPLAAALEATGETPRLGIYFRMETEAGVIRLWSGVGDCDAGINALDAEGGVYSGMGELINVPAFNQLVNGKAQRLTFQLSGADETMLRLADGEEDAVRGAPVMLGVGSFDGRWQVLDPVDWLWYGRGDVMPIRRVSDGDRVQRYLELSVASIFAGRTRGMETYWVSADQKRRSPTDTACDRVPLYTATAQKSWPDF